MSGAQWLRAWFPSRTSRSAAEALLTTVVSVARQPSLYGEGRVADTMAGRLEMVYAHAALALACLRRDPTMAVEAQLFTDGLFRHLDAGLREAGIGDLSVPKHMKRLAQAFYGRVQAYSAPLAARDGAALQAALERNVFAGEPNPCAAELAQYLLACARLQADVPAGELVRLDRWAPLG